MARKPRIEIAGGLYHVISRGNNRRMIFRPDADYLSESKEEGSGRRIDISLLAKCSQPPSLSAHPHGARTVEPAAAPVPLVER